MSAWESVYGVIVTEAKVYRAGRISLSSLLAGQKRGWFRTFAVEEFEVQGS